MIKNNVFNLLLITCAAISISMPNFAMETDLSEEERQWVISGDFNQLVHAGGGSLLSRQVKFKALSTNNYIKEIVVSGYSYGAIEIMVKVAFHQENIDNDLKKFIHEPRESNMFYCDITDSSEFLEAFYKINLIPDFIIGRIITDIGIKDFRMDGNRFIQLINQKINENSTAENFMTIVNEELEKIKNPPSRAQTIVWDLICDLKDSENFDKNVVISLCEKIHNKDLPFYLEAKMIQANLTRGSAKIMDVRDRYHKPITLLLSAAKTENHDMTKQLNLYVKSFYHNDLPGDELPDDLKYLSLSPESMFRLLDVIRKQKLELDQLRKNNSK
jgi:hypothetical protein